MRSEELIINSIDNANSSAELDIFTIIYSILHKWWIVAILATLCGIIGYFYSVASYQPIYEANASLIIKTRQVSISGDEVAVANDIYLAQKMVNTYSIILKSERIMTAVASDLGIDTSPSVLSGFVKITNTKDSEILFVNVTNSDPIFATNIANSIMKIAPSIIKETVEVGSINVLDFARVPSKPLPARYFTYMAIGVLLGIVLAIGLIILLLILFPKIRDSKEIRNKLDLKVLGEIPRSKADRVKMMGSYPVLNSKLDDFEYEEAFRDLGSRISYIQSHSQVKIIAVSSALDGEGKSIVTLNLALSVARTGKKVLLIDCDMRNPTINSIYGEYVMESRSLQAVLDGKCAIEDAIFKNDITGVDYIFSKCGIEDSAKYLSIVNMNSLIRRVEESYDMVLLDMPPAYFISDASTIASCTDGIILVIRQHNTNVGVISDTIQRLNDNGAIILGGVFNDIRYLYKSTGYKYKYMKKRYDKYGYGYSNQKGKSRFEKGALVLRYLTMSACIAGISIFALQTGEKLTSINHAFSQFIAESAFKLGFVSQYAYASNDNYVAKTPHAGLVLVVASHTQYLVHVLMFLVLSLLSLNAFRHRIKTLHVSFIVSFGICSVVLFGSEIWQGLRTTGRAFETSDIINSMIGITLGFLIFGVARLISLTKRKGRHFGNFHQSSVKQRVKQD